MEGGQAHHLVVSILRPVDELFCGVSVRYTQPAIDNNNIVCKKEKKSLYGSLPSPRSEQPLARVYSSDQLPAVEGGPDFWLSATGCYRFKLCSLKRRKFINFLQPALLI
jgi:hypothetical protein